MKRKVWVTEARLSELSGISRTSLTAFRKRKVPRSEWKKGKSKGRPVLYSEAAVERVKAVFGIEEVDLAGESTKGSSESQPALDPKRDTPKNEYGTPPLPHGVIPDGTPIFAMPDLKLVTVSKLVPNKRILFAQNGMLGEPLQVIVPSSEVWAIGDPMRVKPSERHSGYWELVGKAPRWRGDRIYRHEFV